MPKDINGVRRSRFGMIRNTYPDLRSTTIKEWVSVVGEEVGKVVYSAPITQNIRFVLEDGDEIDCEVMFLALDRPDDVRKLRGTQFTWIWFNEAKELPFYVVDKALERLGRYPKRQDVPGGYRYGAVADYNAPDEMNWAYQKAEEEKPDDWEFFAQPGGVIKVNGKWVLNPKAENIRNLPDGYYTRLLNGKAEDSIACELGNIYTMVRHGRPVYEHSYNDQVHSVEKLELLPSPLLLGWDFGRTPAVVIGQEDENGQLRIIKEVFKEGIGVRNFAKQVAGPVIRQLAKGRGIGFSVGDPAGKTRNEDDQSALTILEDEGFPTEPAPGNNALTPRLDAVEGNLNRMIMGMPGMVVCRQGAPIVRKGFVSGYCYGEYNIHGGGGEQRIGDQPQKNRYSHPHDALQYLCIKASEGYGEDDDDFFGGGHQMASRSGY